ncbi:MAG: glycosyltransferase [Lachnospiraceae bacterium]|nr:glycosyltransferase [Lachnospiraceae bacterium]
MEPERYSKLLSICIPSYNRGHRALGLVKSLLEMKCVSEREDVEIIVSNNGSTLYTEEYDEISHFSGERFIYNRFDENIQYWGNYNETVKLSNGHYCFLISDEDRIGESSVAALLEFLEDGPDFGVMKTASTVHYKDNAPGRAAAGEDAIKQFYMAGNYISGALYNRRYVTDDLIDGLKNLYKTDEGYYYYPHLFVEAYVINQADFYFFDGCTVIEGDDEGDMPQAKAVSLPVFASWESRVAQLAGYFKLIRDLNIDDARKQLMFMMAVCKTISLVVVVKGQYLENATEWNTVYVSAGNAILDAVRDCGIPIIENNMEAYLQVVADFIKKDMR